MDLNYEEFGQKILDEEYDKFGEYVYDDSMFNSKYIKEILSQYVMLFRYICGSDSESEKVLSLIDEYTDIIPDDTYTYDSEAWLFFEIYSELVSYIDLAKKQRMKIKRHMEKLSSVGRDNIDQDAFFKERLLFEIAQVRYEIANNLLIFFVGLANGFMPEDEGPKFDISESASSLGMYNMPILVHTPVNYDISDDMKEKSPFFIGLSNIAGLTPERILGMFRDENNGKAIVRLWNKENGEYVPEYVEIDKSKVYIDYMTTYRSECMWACSILAALENSGRSVETSSPEDLIEAMLGPKLKLYDWCDLLFPIPIPELDEDEEEIRKSLFRMTVGVYKDLLSVSNLKASMMRQSVLLMFAIKELMGVVNGAIGRPVSGSIRAVEHLKMRSDNVRRAMISHRISDNYLKLVCDNVDRLYSKFMGDKITAEDDDDE